MPKARVGVRVADDRQSVTVEIGSAEGPSEPTILDVEQLTKVINLLGRARVLMLEGQQIEPLEGTTVDTLSNPMWYIQVAQIDGSLLAFNHLAYGPIAFAIPKHEVAQMVGILKSHLALPMCQPNRPS
jgi:hypothetical protein